VGISAKKKEEKLTYTLDLSKALPVEVESAARDGSKWKLQVKVPGINPVHAMSMNFPLELADEIIGGETYYALLVEGQVRSDRDGNPKLTGKTWDRWYEVREWFGKERPAQAATTGAANGSGWSDEDLDSVRFADSLRTAAIALAPGFTIAREAEPHIPHVAETSERLAAILHTAKAERAAMFAEAHPKPDPVAEDPSPAKIAPAAEESHEAAAPEGDLLPARLAIKDGAHLVRELAHWGLGQQDADRLLGKPLLDWRTEPANRTSNGNPATLTTTWAAIATARNHELTRSDDVEDEDIQW